MGSVSLTLDALKTETTLQFDHSLASDTFHLNNRGVSGKPLQRITDFLDYLNPLKERPRARIVSKNNFPTGAGLASSSSGFAALTLSASHAMGLDDTPEELSKRARAGSGSAARSIYGGFVEMKCGDSPTGEEDYAVRLFDKTHWDLHLLIAVTSTEMKKTGSTEGMIRTAKTSPFYKSWIDSHEQDIKDIKRAIGRKDFEQVGDLTEHSCFKMHGLSMSARPPLLYWNAATTETIHRVWNLRKKGIAAYVTMDAGPQVKVLCLPDSIELVKQAILSVKGVETIIDARPGPAASLVVTEKETIL